MNTIDIDSIIDGTTVLTDDDIPFILNDMNRGFINFETYSKKIIKNLNKITCEDKETKKVYKCKVNNYEVEVKYKLAYIISEMMYDYKSIIMKCEDDDIYMSFEEIKDEKEDKKEEKKKKEYVYSIKIRKDDDFDFSFELTCTLSGIYHHFNIKQIKNIFNYEDKYKLELYANRFGFDIIIRNKNYFNIAQFSLKL